MTDSIENSVVDDGRVTVGKIFGRSFQLAKENFLHGLLFFVVISVLYAIVSSLVLGASVASLSGGVEEFEQAFSGLEVIPGIIALIIFVLVMVFWVGAVMARMSLRYLGQDANFTASLSLAARRIPRLLIVSILALMAVFGGFVVLSAVFRGADPGPLGVILFIIAFIFTYWIGIRLLPMMAVAVTEEDAGIIGSISRGFKLSGGRWWTIFGANFCIGLVIGLMQLVVNFTLLIPVVGIILFVLLFYFDLLIVFCLSMATYIELVADKEGAPTQDVSDVFD